MLFSKKDPEKEAQKEYAHYLAHIEDCLISTIGGKGIGLNAALSSNVRERMECSRLSSSFGTYYLEDVFTEFVSDDIWEKFVERVNVKKSNYAKRQNKIFIKKEVL